MFDNDNNDFLSWWQAVLLTVAFVLFAGLLVFCGLNVTISTTPPKTVPAPAPAATPSPLYVILTEQAKASAKVQVITAETDNEIRLRWHIHFMRRWWAVWLIPVLVIVGTSAWLLAYRRGQR